MKSINLIAVSIVFLFGSCSLFQPQQYASDQSASNLNAKWHIISIDNKKIADKVNGIEPSFSVDIAKKEYAAITGCNNLMGNFEVKAPNKIKMTRGISTMMACDNMDVELGLSRIIPTITNYKLANDTLSLLDAKKNIKAQFKLKKENKSALLKGGWELDYMGMASAPVEELFPTKKPTLEFDIKEETFTGNGGCNTYSSTYQLDGHKLKFSAIASTKMACPALEGESMYFKNLQGISSFSVNDDQLTLITDDIAVLRFKKIKK